MSESAKSLLVYHLKGAATIETMESLQKMLMPMGAKLNAEVLVTDDRGAIELHPGAGQFADLIEAMKEHCEVAREQTVAFIGLCQTAAALMQLLVDQEMGTDDEYEQTPPAPEYLEQRTHGG